MLAVLVWLVTVSGLSLIVSPDRWGGGGDEIQIVILSMAFIAGAGLESLDDVLSGLCAGMAVSSTLAVAQWLGFAGWIAQGSPHPAGLFFNSEVLAETDAALFVWAALRPRPALAAILAIPLVLCRSRVAVLAALAGLAYALVRPLWARLLLCAAIMAGGIFSIFLLGIDKLGSAFERLVIWLAMGEAITPLGRGLGWVYLALPHQQFAHSDALQAIVEVGIPAIALVVIPIAAFCGSRGNRAERAAFLACCAEVLVSFPLRVPVSGFVAALLAGNLAGAWSPVRGFVSQGGMADGGSLLAASDTDERADQAI